MDRGQAVGRVLEEFYCATSGGGCGGFMCVRINKALNGVVEIVCPKCGHQHRRGIKNGVLQEDGRAHGTIMEQLCPTLACWTKEATHPESKRRVGDFRQERNAVVVEENPQSRRFLNERKFELWGGLETSK